MKDSCKESGIALLIVMFIVALATMVVSSLTYSTYLASRVNRNFERQIRAEYLLKSALSLARVIIASDKGTSDPPKDSWGLFRQGADLPLPLLGIEDPDVKVTLEIDGESKKIGVNWLNESSRANEVLFKQRREVLRRLFELLNFDSDEQLDQSPLFKGKFFNSFQLVANLIDYMDSDSVPYSDGQYVGAESAATKDIFANAPLERLTELNSIPGFTPERVRILSRFLTSSNVPLINVNLASKEIIRALDSSLSEADAARIVAEAQGKDGPLTSTTLSPLMPNAKNLNSLLSYSTSLLQVIAKVQIADSRYFLRATVRAESSTPDGVPAVQKREMFG